MVRASLWPLEASSGRDIMNCDASCQRAAVKAQTWGIQSHYWWKIIFLGGEMPEGCGAGVKGHDGIADKTKTHLEIQRVTGQTDLER